MGRETQGVTRRQRKWKCEARLIGIDDFGNDFVSAQSEVLPNRALLLRRGAVFVEVEPLRRGRKPIDEGRETNREKKDQPQEAALSKPPIVSFKIRVSGASRRRFGKGRSLKCRCHLLFASNFLCAIQARSQSCFAAQASASRKWK